MINRILDFSEAPARLRVRYAQLIVQRQDLPEVSVPLADLAVILVAHPQVTFTQAVLSGLARRRRSVRRLRRPQPARRHDAAAGRASHPGRTLRRPGPRTAARAQAALAADRPGEDRGPGRAAERTGGGRPRPGRAGEVGPLGRPEQHRGPRRTPLLAAGLRRHATSAATAKTKTRTSC